MKLLIITQKVNINDPILGFFHRWIEEFSKHYEEVQVICLEKGEFNLPANVKVYSLGKDEGLSKIQFILRFYRYIWQLKDEYDEVFVHMNQIYILLGGIFWKVLNRKIGLWYVHRQKSFSLWIATLLADKIFTSSKESFGYQSLKVNYLGHGIDISKYTQTGIPLNFPKVISYIGRISPIKNLEALINGIVLLNTKYPGEYTCELIGEPVTSVDNEYKKSLEQIIRKNSLLEVIKFKGGKNQLEIPSVLNKAWSTVNLSPTGGMDKTVLESLASNRPVFASNEAFSPMFGEYKEMFVFEQNNGKNLALNIEKFAHNPSGSQIIKELSDKVRKEYDVTNLVNKIIKILNE